MKKKLLLSVLMMLFVGIDALAVEWKDENGVTWRFDQGTLTINGEKQKLWVLTGASGYGEHVIIPEVMYNGETPCTIEALGVDGSNYNLFGMSVRHVRSLTLPSTLKYIGAGALTMYSGMVYATGATPPELYRNTASDCIGEGITVVVPDEHLDTYREAPGWSDMAVRILNQSVKTDYIVSTTAMPSASGLHAVIGEENLGNVMSLKVSGTINSYDFIVMRNKMHNLHHLDLTDAVVKASSYAYYQNYKTSDNTIGKFAFYKLPKLMTVKLPTSITTVENQAFNTCQGLLEVVCQGGLTTISDYAFGNCYRLQTVTLNDRLQTIGRDAFYECYELKSLMLGEDLQSIGINAFYNCNSLKTVTAQGNALETINNEAFRGCTSLKTVTLKPGIKTIGDYAFRGCSNLTSINLPQGLKTIGMEAFRSCSSLPSIDIPEGILAIMDYTFFGCSSLVSAKLPTTLMYIWNYAFTNCTSLADVSLPEHLKNIGESTFYNCSSLTEIHIPSSIRSIGANAFAGASALNDIHAYTMEPTEIQENTFSSWTTAKLHVPTLSYYTYYYQEPWNKFAFLVKEDSYKYRYFYLNKVCLFDKTLTTAPGEQPDVDMNPGSGIIVEEPNSTVTLGDVHMMSNSTSSSSIVAKGDLTIENLFFDMEVAANKWYFLSLPFRVKAENVTAPGPYVFRYYDGATRAANGKGGWKNHEGTYLEAHTGYIFQTNTAGTLTFQVEPADVSFSGATRQDALATHAAADAKNASWNFMGNPFPSYYDIDNTGYAAPITVWNGSSYIAVRPGDDQYQIGPFEAFFVQKPETVTNMEFPFEGCHTYSQWADIVAGKNKAPRRAGQKNRLLVNLTIGTDETVDDRTRVVFNEQKTTAYELDCDAAKFLSSEPVAQLYSLDDEQSQYAINERPMGDVRLGYVAAEGGMLTITAERMDQPVLLYDKLMNIQHDLSTGGYMFSTEAGTFNDRFVMTINGHATAITQHLTPNTQHPTPNTQHPTDVFSLGGTHVSSKGTDGLSSGTYVVKQGSVSTKVIVK